ncbi:hypothetical protein AHAS_Ahas12G0162700 [Arachis hypogaea]
MIPLEDYIIATTNGFIEEYDAFIFSIMPKTESLSLIKVKALLLVYENMLGRF